MSEQLDRLKELRVESDDMDEFVKQAAEENLTVSMGQGRRLWSQLEGSAKKDKEQ